MTKNRIHVRPILASAAIACLLLCIWQIQSLRLVLAEAAPKQTGATANKTNLFATSLAGIIVNSLDDGAPANNNQCTLREALINANNNNQSGSTDCAAGSGADVITFGTSGTINLTSALPEITDNLSINDSSLATVTIRRNSNDAYRIFTIKSGVTASLANLTITNGSLPASEGGGIWNFGNLTVTNCTISGNLANGGGGLYNIGTLTMNGCTISGNTANFDGGGVYNNHQASLMNCTISGNAGISSGIMTLATSGEAATTALVNCTVTANMGSSPAIKSFNFGGTPSVITQLKNTLVAENGGSNFDINANTILTSLGNNLDSDGSGGFTNGVGGNLAGTASNKLDAKLAPLGNNGGLTLTHALLPGSPAIDAGGATGAPTTDQRGVTRPQDGDGIGVAVADIGAFEVVSINVNSLADGVPTNDGNCTLREAIINANNNNQSGSTDCAPGRGGDTISLRIGGTINLSSALPDITDNLSLNGPGANLLTVRRNATDNFDLFDVQPFASTQFNISRLTLSNGKSSSNGGAVFSFGFLSLADCAFVGNEAAGNGGAVYLTGASGKISGCTFSGNTANGSGGAVAYLNGEGRLLRISNTTISGNLANSNIGGGAGLFNFSSNGSSTVEVLNCTIVNNTGNNAGGIFTGAEGAGAMATTTLRNTIVSNNTAPNLKTQIFGNGSPSIVSAGNNLSSDNGGGFLTGSGDQINRDPKLGPLANNGGPTQTHLLLCGSPAINAGSSAGSTSADQRGNARPFNSLPDIGAVEGIYSVNIVQTPMPNGQVGATYSAGIYTSASSIPLPYEFTAVTSLPAGLKLEKNVGGYPVITGIPTVAINNFSFTLMAVDFSGRQGCFNYTITIAPACSAFSVNAKALPNGRPTEGYLQTLTQTGGIGAISWSLGGGTLPRGLSLNTTTGQILGMPSLAGTFNFTVKATDANRCSDSEDFSINIVCHSIAITSALPPGGKVNTAYTHEFISTGAINVESFSLVSGSLPPGLTLGSAGRMGGTPTQSGSFTASVKATDSTTCTSNTQTFTIVIAPVECGTMTINPVILTSATVNISYAQNFSASGGNGAYRFSVASGSFPVGLALSSTGQLSGVPTSPGLSIFTLTVTDANNCTFSHSFTLNVFQQQQSVAADGATGDQFGAAVAISGDMSVIGAPGVNAKRGLAYLYRRNTNGVWVEQARLSANNGAAGDQFGSAVSIAGSFILIGAKGRDVAGKTDQGSAYAFSPSNAPVNILQQQELIANDGAANDRFGSSVAINLSPNGNGIIIGAPGRTTNTGAAYVFDLVPMISQPAWDQTTILLANNGKAGDFFGSSVGFNGSVAVIGAPRAPSAATLTGESIASNPEQALAQGTAYLFTRNVGVTNWAQKQITPSDGAAGDQFGSAVAISGNYVVIGAPGKDASKGGAYIFGVNGEQLASLDTNISITGSVFGSAVSISGDLVLVGAPGDLGAIVSLAPEQNSPALQGFASLFGRNGTSWPLQQIITSGNGQSTQYGGAVAVDGKNIVVGASQGSSGKGKTELFDPCPDVTLVFNPANLPVGSLNTQYSQSIAVTGGTAPYVYAVTEGLLPTGLTLSTGGLFIGSPTQSGSFFFTVRVTDAASCIASRPYQLTINALPALVASVNAASYSAAEVAPSSIVAAFGANLASGIAVGGTKPLPTSLLGTTIKVKDSAGIERLAPLFFVSPGQINYLMPAATAAGEATVTITSGDGSLSAGKVQVANVAPGLFTANANGKGVPAAEAWRFNQNGQYIVQSMTLLQNGQFVPAPIDLGPLAETTYLVLYGTGIRGRNKGPNGSFSATLGGVNLEFPFADAVNAFEGLDQINLGPLPRTLAGRGIMDLIITIDGKALNATQVNIK